MIFGRGILLNTLSSRSPLRPRPHAPLFVPALTLVLSSSHATWRSPVRTRPRLFAFCTYVCPRDLLLARAITLPCWTAPSPRVKRGARSAIQKESKNHGSQEFLMRESIKHSPALLLICFSPSPLILALPSSPWLSRSPLRLCPCNHLFALAPSSSPLPSPVDPRLCTGLFTRTITLPSLHLPARSPISINSCPRAPLFACAHALPLRPQKKSLHHC